MTSGDNNIATLARLCCGEILSSPLGECGDSFVFNGGLKACTQLLAQDTPELVIKEVLWMLSNLTAGSDSHIRAFLNDQVLVNKCIECFGSDSGEIRREAIYIFTNLVTTS